MELYHDENAHQTSKIYPHKAGKSVVKDHFMMRKSSISAFSVFFHELRKKAKRSGIPDLTPGSSNYDKLVKQAKRKWHSLDSKSKSRYDMRANMENEQRNNDIRDMPENKDMRMHPEQNENNSRRRSMDSFPTLPALHEPLRATDPVFISLDNIPRSPELAQWARSFIEQMGPIDDAPQKPPTASTPELFEWADSFIQDQGNINNDTSYRYDNPSSILNPSQIQPFNIEMM